MHILLYDESLRSKYVFKDAVLFYISKPDAAIYCNRIYISEHNFFAQLEQDRVFRGQLEFKNSRHGLNSELSIPRFRLLFDQHCIQVSQTVLISPFLENITDDAKMREILNVYDVSEEHDPTFNIHDTVKVMNQCKDTDTLRLYMLSALPYLNNCTIADIIQFTDVYNTKLRMLLI